MPPPKTRLPKIRGIKTYESRGQTYHYHRATNTRLTSEYGSVAFLLEIAKLDEKRSKVQTGSLAKVIELYRRSPVWKDLAPATRLSYDRAFAALDSVRERPIKQFTPPFVAKLRDLVLEVRGRWMANYVLTVLVILFDFAREDGSVDSNPARDVRRVKKDKKRPIANRPWEVSECRAVLSEAPSYLAVPIALAMFAGFRKGDVLALGKEALILKTVQQDGKPVEFPFLTHKTTKRGVDVAFPVHPALANVLALAPAHNATTLAANSRGIPWTESGFNSTFGKMIDRLQEVGKVGPGLTMHGLRHTVGTRLIEAGASLDDVKRLLGQQSTAMAQHYTKTADISDRTALLIGKMKVISE